MRTQYKILAEKYTLINEGISEPMRTLFKNVLRASTLEEVIGAIQSSSLYPGMLKKGMSYGHNMGYDRGIDNFPLILNLPSPPHSYSPTYLFHSLLARATAYAQQDGWHKRNPNENSPQVHLRDAQVAWNGWWNYYEPLRASVMKIIKDEDEAAELMKKAEREADIKLDI